MEVTNYELFEVPPRSLLLKVETDDGLVGWGEPVLEGRAQTAAETVRELMENYVIGADPYDIELLWQQMYRSGFYRGGAVLMSALSGIDQALWDIKGKALGNPSTNCSAGRPASESNCTATWAGRTSETPRGAESRRVQCDQKRSWRRSRTH